MEARKTQGNQRERPGAPQDAGARLATGRPLARPARRKAEGRQRVYRRAEPSTRSPREGLAATFRR